MDNPVYAFKRGAFDCLVIAEAVNPNIEDRIRSVFTRDPAPILAAWRGLNEPQSDCRNLLVLKRGDERILIDAGQGELDPAHASALTDTLSAQGISAEAITAIIITHFDGDHIGGLLDGSGKSRFANARLIVPAPEYAYWMDDATLAALAPERADLLRRTFAAYADRLDIMGESAEIMPGIHYVPAFGHKPGQCAVLIESEGERLLHAADAIHMVMQLNALESVPKFDVQPDVAIATRRALIERVEREHLLMLAYHFTFPGMGYIERGENGLVWLPLG